MAFLQTVMNKVNSLAPADAWNVSHGDCTLVWYHRGGWLLLANAARPRSASLMQSACPQHKIVTSPAVKINGYSVPLKFETLYRSGDTYGTLRRHVCPRVRWLVRHLAWIVFVVVRGGWVAGSSASHDATASVTPACLRRLEQGGPCCPAGRHRRKGVLGLRRQGNGAITDALAMSLSLAVAVEALPAQSAIIDMAISALGRSTWCPTTRTSPPSCK